MKATSGSSKYVIFSTKWGYFGLGATENGVCCTVLPMKSYRSVEKHILSFLPRAEFDKNLHKSLQNKVIRYYQGFDEDFSKVAVDISTKTEFQKRVLKFCRAITAGKTASYSCLAKRAGAAGASRAVGSALAKNPVPLVIPCHRVIKTDGSMGGFSGSGGVNCKKRLLALEKHIHKKQKFTAAI